MLKADQTVWESLMERYPVAAKLTAEAQAEYQAARREAVILAKRTISLFLEEGHVYLFHVQHSFNGQLMRRFDVSIPVRVAEERVPGIWSHRRQSNTIALLYSLLAEQRIYITYSRECTLRRDLLPLR
jgi:hypothetical protein